MQREREKTNHYTNCVRLCWAKVGGVRKGRANHRLIVVRAVRRTHNPSVITLAEIFKHRVSYIHKINNSQNVV